MTVFFTARDYRRYRILLARQARRHQLSIWAYCLMPNHVHLIVVPSTECGLGAPIGEAHRRYALLVNRRHGWTGHLWQERFASAPMDERHLRAAIRYVLLNPVRAGLVARASDWPHSSARAHVLGEVDRLVDREPAAERIADWDSFLSPLGSLAEDEFLRKRTRVGRPAGSKEFVSELEKVTGRSLRRRKRGPKPRN